MSSSDRRGKRAEREESRLERAQEEVREVRREESEGRREKSAGRREKREDRREKREERRERREEKRQKRSPKRRPEIPKGGVLNNSNKLLRVSCANVLKSRECYEEGRQLESLHFQKVPWQDHRCISLFENRTPQGNAEVVRRQNSVASHWRSHFLKLLRPRQRRA